MSFFRNNFGLSTGYIFKDVYDCDDQHIKMNCESVIEALARKIEQLEGRVEDLNTNFINKENFFMVRRVNIEDRVSNLEKICSLRKQ